MGCVIFTAISMVVALGTILLLAMLGLDGLLRALVQALGGWRGAPLPVVWQLWVVSAFFLLVTRWSNVPHKATASAPPLSS